MNTDASGYPSQRWLIAFVVGLSAFMEVLDISIANVSLSHIAGSLAASESESTWILTAYLVSNAIILPISGWFSQLLGRRRFFLLSIVLFAVASLASGLAPTLNWLIFFRVLQGLGGGGLQPVSQAILADSFPPKQRGMAFSIYGIAVVFAPAIGPTLGGYITDNYSWHWIFLLNVPVGALLLALAMPLIHDSAAYQKAREAKIGQHFRIDFIGMFLLAAGLGCLQIMLDQGQQDNWFSSSFIVSMAVIAVATLTALVLWEPFQHSPMVDLKLFRFPNFALANVLMFMLGFVLFGSTLLIPQFVQALYGYTSMLAGLVLSPGGLAIVFFMPLVGYLSGKVAARWLIAFGLATTSASLFHLSGFNLHVTFSQLMWARIYQTVGLAFLFIPITDAAYYGVPSDKTDEVSAMINLSRNIGGSVGISLVTTWLAKRQQFHQHVLISHITPYSHATKKTLHGLTQHFEKLGSNAGHATHQAYGVIYNQVQQQAAMLSYIDDYWLLGVLLAILTPFVLLIGHNANK
mgnify:CR=1 FL=1